MVTAEQLFEFMKTSLRLRRFDGTSVLGKERGWDSLTHVRLMLALEREYSVVIPPERFGELDSADKIVAFFAELGLVTPPAASGGA